MWRTTFGEAAARRAGGGRTWRAPRPTRTFWTLSAMAGALAAWTWNVWADPVVDFGREMYVAWRIASGERLYLDVAYFNGPLSPHLNAVALGLGGGSLAAVYSLNAVVLVLIAWLVFDLTAYIAGRRCAATCVGVFLTWFAFALYTHVRGFNYLAPYSHEMTHGVLLSLAGFYSLKRWIESPRIGWLATAGAALGLLFLTKPEIFAAAALGYVALFVGWIVPASWADNVSPRGIDAKHGDGSIIRPTFRDGLRIRPAFRDGSHIRPAAMTAFGGLRNFALVACCAAGVWAVGVALLNTYLPLGDAVACSLGGWRYVGNSRITGGDFYRWVSGLDRPAFRAGTLVFWLVTQTLLLRLGLRWAATTHQEPHSPAPEERPANPFAFSATTWLLLVVAAGCLWLFPDAKGYANAFAALPVWLAVIAFVGWRKLWRSARPGGNASECRRVVLGLALTVFALGLLAKIFLNVRIYHYGFALAMPATLVALAAVWLFAEAMGRRGLTAWRVAAPLAACMLVVGGIHLKTMQRVVRHYRQVPVAGVAATGPWATPHEAEAINAMLAQLDRRVKPTQTLAVWPQGGLMNVLSRRRNSTPYSVLLPPELEMFGERAIEDAYRRSPPDFVLLTHSDTRGYGQGHFGQGYAKGLWRWLETNYAPVAKAGAPPFASNQFGMVLLERAAQEE